MISSLVGRFVSGATLGTFFGILGGVAPAAQVGHVVSAQKISDTAGGFGALLDEEDQFGRSIVNLGDMDGDGVTDLMVGAHTDDDGGLDKGSVYILFLNENGSVKTWRKISDLEGNFAGRLDPGDQFGRAAANIGDLDGDGVIDLAVSSNYDDDGGANKGAVYILFLNADGTVKGSQKISSLVGGFTGGLRMHDEFGRSITSLGDLNGDGVTDIVVGTPEDDEGGTNTGALHVIFLNANGTVKSNRRIGKFSSNLAIKPGDWFGFCTTNLGDFDGDGVTDIAAGAVLDDDGGVNQGAVWILCLNSDGSLKSSREIHELTPGFGAPLDDIDQFGTSVANIGDLNGDGVVDIAVGAVKDDDGGIPGNVDADVGAVYVLFLNADATVKSWVKIGDISGDLPYSLDQYDWFGSALARLGGSPNDGLFNVAIGCRNDDDGSPNRGSIYLVQLNDGSAPAADFTASRTLGVAPLTVEFADTSTGEVTAWVWNFDDGNNSSLRNPTKTFTASGTYDVQLLARGPRGKDTEKKRAFITVVPGPLADFSATPDTGTAPLTVQFTDRTEGAVTSWSWNFGDGSSSTASNPAHVFATGTWTVSLTVTGPRGTDTHTALIHADDLAPEANFAADARDGVAPHAVQFSDLSTGSVSSWSWSFGDGATSTERNPAHAYAQPGSYTVTLTVSGSHGSDVEQRIGWIQVASPVPVADFDATPFEGTAPLAVEFADLSSGDISSYAWSFGDGATSSESNPLHVYDQAGQYTVALTVAGPHGSNTLARSALIKVVEPPPRAEFLTTSTTGYAPFTTQFTDQSSGIVTSRTWSFGDGETSSDEIAVHTYASPGTYDVSLTVTSPYGSSTESKAELVRVQDPTPVAAFGAPLTSGIAPLAVQFTDRSQGLVTSWQWDFGDGGTSFESNPEHVYLVPGSYSVRLLVSGPAGSDDELRADLVNAIDPPPTADFQAATSAGFAPLAVQFNDRSHGRLSAHAWSFGDGTGSEDTNPAHLYTAPGTYDVALMVAGPGGSAAAQRSGLIRVLDPRPSADFAAGATSGVAPLDVQFADTSAGWVTAWSWSFGDGETSSEASPRHTYSTPGTYAVRLTASGPSGTDVELKSGFVTVQWPAPAPEFSGGPVAGFAPLSVAFTDFSIGNVTSWTWNFGDGTVARKRYPLKVYTRPGSYTVTLTVKGPGGTRSIARGGILVAALPQFSDGGFELQTANGTPNSPWTESDKPGARIRTNTRADGGFPREGSQWLEIDGTASSAATPPSNPGGTGALPTGTVKVSRVFAFQPLAPHLEFDAAFVLGELAASPTRNDFLSVDVTDGSTTWNIHYADSFSALPGTSTEHGDLPMTAVQHVRVDLRTLFPGLAPGAPITLHVGVGNVGGATRPSYGYVDAFRLVPAAIATFRNGTGRNAARYGSSPAIIGGNWTIQVDTTGHTGARAIQLVGLQRPASGVVKPTGEALGAGQRLFTQTWPAQMGLNVRTIALPPDSALIGQYMSTQVTITGGRAELTNAFDILPGF